jgi:hypothetical protein
VTAPELVSGPSAPAGQRLLFGLAGLTVLIGGGIVTLGLALVGAVAIGIAWLVLRRRNRQLTRGRAWLVSAGAVAVLFLGVFAFALLLETDGPTVSPEELAQARARSRDSMPAWLKTMTASSAQGSPAADSVAQKLSQNPMVMLWLGAVGAIFTSAVLGALAGTIGWGGVMLLYRAAQGRWMIPREQIST